MAASVKLLLDRLDTKLSSIEFAEIIAFIDTHYEFKETAFANGGVVNKAGENSGSCKVFSFALLHNLTETQTLGLFAEHYRDAVALNPDGDDHQNIRQFIRTGFAGLTFSDTPLKPLS